jgi:hypothetical protein
MYTTKSRLFYRASDGVGPDPMRAPRAGKRPSVLTGLACCQQLQRPKGYIGT